MSYPRRLTRALLLALTALTSALVGIGTDGASAASATPAVSASNASGPPVSLQACQNLRADATNDTLRNGAFTLTVYYGSAEIMHSVPIHGPRPDVYLSRSWSRSDYRPDPSAGEGTYLAFYCNGDLALRHQDGLLIWHTNTAGRGGVRVSLTSTGNLVMYTAAGGVVWQAGSGPSAMATNSLLRSNSRLVYVPSSPSELPESLSMQTDGNLVLRTGTRVRWQSGTHVPGSYAGLTTRAQLVVVSPSGKILWSSHPAASSASVLTMEQETVTQFQPTEKIIWWFST